MTDPNHLRALFAARYPDPPQPEGPVPDALAGMAARGSCRRFADRAVPDALLETLCAVALATPTKSDLQQRDIVLVTNPEARARLAGLVSGQGWVAGAPVLAVFCGNNRRQRLLHAWHGVAFANDHLDAFFNAAVDAGIALAGFVTAAEAMGLGCCPISAVRNEAAAVSELLGLPDHVFPVAGLAIGWPAAPPEIAMRLPLGATVHRDRYREGDLRAEIAAYDTARAAHQPYTAQRFPDRFGASDTYGWSEDKARQYSAPERADFGAFIRAKGFKLD
ncbi:nitroreductase family protein [Jannaschia seohaensis]|uniref:Nitroreductase/FMN reductase [NAD(P)H] n=1 Tax=Jannaschia seohaensis TaxID=475081 RepID=A0A2Y9A7B5_9RHOB|nr:nitroreductase family protein [Jannaschia seohaensis]PWJ21789.1 nitroreductase/FMN reductase [NAD(P)H] [Jannaschia seohaensis]SSA38067.1 nitroreductase/FMN reductase [NAD(P)H] [Jannaschia seohaensis]